MKRKPLLLLILFTVSFSKGYALPPSDFFTAVQQLIKGEKSYSRLYATLDSLKQTCIPSRSDFYLYLDRDMDAGFRHKCLVLRLNLEPYQLDLLTIGDTIFFRGFSYTDGNKKDFDLDKDRVAQYLQQRNQLYGSRKTIGDLKRELLQDEIFATHCGDGSPITRRGRELNELVREEDVETLHSLLVHFSPEEQAYGVEGLERLLKQGFPVPERDRRIMQHIRRRNAEVVTCSGCLSGIVEKIYTTRYDVEIMHKNSRVWNQLRADTLLKPSGFVTDHENLFTDAEVDTLTKLLVRYEKETTNEIVVVTIPAYATTAAEFDDYTLYLANKWGVGKRDKHNGILIGISKSLRIMRIRNGYGIEQKLTDKKTKEIIDRMFLPAFKNAAYFEGTLKGVMEIMRVVR